MNSEAVRQAKQGKHFDQLLAAAYPGGALSTFGNTGARCQRLAQNEDWLARSMPRWRRVLLREAGYEAPPQAPLVVRLRPGLVERVEIALTPPLRSRYPHRLQYMERRR